MYYNVLYIYSYVVFIFSKDWEWSSVIITTCIIFNIFSLYIHIKIKISTCVFTTWYCHNTDGQYQQGITVIKWHDKCDMASLWLLSFIIDMWR